MNARTWSDGGQFYKGVSGRSEAHHLIARAAVLSSEGTNTPIPRYDPDQKALSFPRLKGISGVALIDEVPLPTLLTPLQSLRYAKIPELAAFDPFTKITTRLDANTPPWLTARIDALRDTPNGSGGVVHGDFHCGQMIRDESDCLWLIDLDDMARGAIEADLGNFAAHLATRPETGKRCLSEDLPFWAEQVHGAWLRLGETCDTALFRRHADIAVTRRALKLRGLRNDHEVFRALENLTLLSR